MGRVIGVDVGGTFTDVTVFEDGVLTGLKVTTSEDQADAVAGAVDWRPDDVLLHGTTAATNALLEERGADIVLVTNSGYEDLIEIGRQDRPSLYDSAIDRPTPLVARDRRVGHGGAREETVNRVVDLAPEAVAVGLIEAYGDRTDEQELAGLIRQRIEAPVVEATSISPEFREYERLATAVLSAYLTPSVAGYLNGLSQRVDVARALVMTSAGGLLPFVQAGDSAARLVLSGPAGGVVAAAALARYHGYDQVISFDMGGTSTDVCRISGSQVTVGPGHQIAGRVNRVPSVPVRTIGAGGGSVGWVDPGGALRVGPRSAGSIPGPAAYDQGGTEPTVTDANIVAGHIPESLALAGSLQLDAGLSHRAMANLANAVGMNAEATAQGMLEIVDSHMEHALRAVTIEEGADPRESVLVAFGGAGGLHAARLARRLGIPQVLIPPLSGVFSALGLLMATPRADAVLTVMLSEHDERITRMSAAVGQTADREYERIFGSEPVATRISFDCRYTGQSHELEVEICDGGDGWWQSVRKGFEQAHLRYFGFTRSGEPVEVVNIRASSTGEAPLSWDRVTGQRPHLVPGAEITGPTVLTEDTSAVLLEEGDRLVVLGDGTLEITYD